MKADTISLVLPAYNEASAVGEVVGGAIRAGVDNVVVVDHGSEDGTFGAVLGIVVRFLEGVLVVRHETNRGRAQDFLRVSSTPSNQVPTSS